MPNLAINGGEPIRKTPFPRYITLGEDEKHAVMEVLDGGVLSQFLGTWSPDFYGGPRIQKFEREWAAHFGVKHAITVNSATSGLYAAVGAAGISPGDEVIVSPYTMSASATAAIIYGGIPVFADIDSRTFNLDPKSIEANITPYTKAIMVADIFGQSAEMDSIMHLAKAHNLKVISDTAQAPGALYKGQFAGTCADIGGYSLNYHKHIHTGEGGVLVTNDDVLAERLQLIRNHAEVVVGGKGVKNLSNMIGFNFRLGEIECAIGIEQLKKLNILVESRQKLAQQLTYGLEGLKGLLTPHIQNDSTHVYYGYPIILNIEELGVGRNMLHQALVAEGVSISKGYQNIHLLPMYQQKIAYGANGFPWSSEICKRKVSYERGICPVAEELHESTYMGIGLCQFAYTAQDIDLIISAFHKVWENLSELQREKK
jgi:dTDP-4-amino-4,6-dideoxygalactose transaminase